MKKIITTTAALAALAGTYVATFGIPDPVRTALPFLAQSEYSAGSDTNTTKSTARASRATAVVLEPLVHKPYTATIQTIGSANSWRSVEVTAEATGRITESFLTGNTEIEAGAVLVRLEDRAEKLSLQMAQAEQKQAQSVVTRFNKIRNSGNSSVTDALMDEANLTLTQAKISVGMAQVALDERTIRAPITGHLGLSDLEVGDLVTESDVIVSIDDSSTLEVEFEVPERAVSMLKIGRTVLASTPSYAGRVFEAEITAFDSRLDNSTRSVTVKAQVDNTSEILWSGMTFAVRLLNDSAPMASVPATALSWTRHGAGIWVVENGQANRQPVIVRFRQGGNVWVDTNIPAGTTVVTEGAVKLRDGSTIKAVPGILAVDTPFEGIASDAVPTTIDPTTSKS